MADLARYFSGTTRQVALTPLSVADTGVTQLGQAISGVGDVLDGIAQKDEDFWLQKTLADIDGESTAMWDASVNSAQDGAAGFAQGYLGQLDQRYAAAKQSAPSARAAQNFELAAMRHRNAQQQVATGFETQEKYAFRVDTIKSEADNLATDMLRSPAVPPWTPQQTAVPNPRIEGGMPAGGEYFSTGITRPEPGGLNLPNNIGEWNSKYYSPRDFADGADMADRSGSVAVSKRVVTGLDWVTEQFGYGRLQINSGYRSPESNVKRAESGPDGPHTHGESVDIQVRDLPQAEKDRLYSLLHSAGFNAFGFGEGVLHAEIRDGVESASWTYGNAKPYTLRPTAKPITTAPVTLTMADQSAAQTNLRPFAPGEQRQNADGTISTEITQTRQMDDGKWVNIPSLWMADDGWVEFSPDDEEGIMRLVTQYETAKGQTFERYESLADAEKAARARSEQGGAAVGPQVGGQPIPGLATGMVPAWEGPVPNIDDVPGYADRMERIDAMVETMPGTPDQRRDLKAEMQGQVVRSWLSSVAQTNPSAAMAALMSGRYDDALTVGDTAAGISTAQGAWTDMQRKIEQSQKELMTALKTEAQTLLADETVSLAATGESLGMLSPAHEAVLSNEEREALSYAKFQYDVTKQVNTSSMGSLAGLLEELRPDGEGFANEQKRYNFAVEQVQARQTRQETDAAGYVMETYPQVNQRWNAALQSNDPTQITAAMQGMYNVQRSLGISNIQLLPNTAAADIAAQYNNPEIPEQQRIGQLVGMVKMAPTAEQQRMVFDQLVKAGVPDTAEAAMEAELRGDSGAARRLFQATMLDPTKLPGTIAAKATEIDQAIQDRIMDQGLVGDLYYGLVNGDASNFAEAERDSKLITSAVQLRLQQGQELYAAVDAVAKDVFGDVVPVTGNFEVNAQILLPPDEDPAPVLAGLSALKSDVGAAMVFEMPDDPALRASGQGAVASAAMTNYRERVLAEGYFRNASNGYVFIDPFVGGAVMDKDGAVIVFTDAQVATAAGMAPKKPTGMGLSGVQQSTPGLGGKPLNWPGAQ